MHTFLANNGDRTVNEVRVRTDSAAHGEPFSLAIFIADAEGDAAFAAKQRGCTFTVPAVDRHVGMQQRRLNPGAVWVEWLSLRRRNLKRTFMQAAPRGSADPQRQR